MSGLENDHHGGRSPPLMIGALITCIMFLGFSYWVSCSRNLELQTKLYELEGQVRRGAAERQLKSDEFQEQIMRQKEQLNHTETFFKTQLGSAQDNCNQEKGTLQQNISSSAKTIQELKGQLNQLNNDLTKVQKALQSCQGNIKTPDDKLTYDMTHCQSAAAVSQTPSVSQSKANEPPELLTNEIIKEKGPDAPADLSPAKEFSEVESQSSPSAAAVKQDILPPPVGAVTTDEGEDETSKLVKNNLTDDKDMELMDVHEEGAQTEGNHTYFLAGKVKADETPAGQKTEEPEDYDAEDQGEGGVDEERHQQNTWSETIDLEQELSPSDYEWDAGIDGDYYAYE